MNPATIYSVRIRRVPGGNWMDLKLIDLSMRRDIRGQAVALDGHHLRAQPGSMKIEMEILGPAPDILGPVEIELKSRDHGLTCFSVVHSVNVDRDSAGATRATIHAETVDDPPDEWLDGGPLLVEEEHHDAPALLPNVSAVVEARPCTHCGRPANTVDKATGEPIHLVCQLEVQQ